VSPEELNASDARIAGACLRMSTYCMDNEIGPWVVVGALTELDSKSYLLHLYRAYRSQFITECQALSEPERAICAARLLSRAAKHMRGQ